MPLTGLPNGVTSFGAPVLPSGSPWANHWWVDGNLGAPSQSGEDRSAPLKTMAAALAKVASGDTIHVRGNIAENLTAPAGIFGVTIIGPSPRMRHPDAHTGNNGYTSMVWKAAVQTDPLFIVRQQGWQFVNILFDAPTSDACLEFIRDAAAGDSERDSSHAAVIECRFVSGATGILISGGENVFNVHVLNSTFSGLTDAIDSPGAYAHEWQIINNKFLNNTNHIDSGFTNSVIQHNTFGKFTTMAIDLSGGATNSVNWNSFSGDYDAKYLGGTSDDWSGNSSMDITSGEVDDAGLTNAAPVA